MAGPPERNIEAANRWKAANAKRIKSSNSKLVKRIKHIDWYDESEEEHF